MVESHRKLYASLVAHRKYKNKRDENNNLPNNNNVTYPYKTRDCNHNNLDFEKSGFSYYSNWIQNTDLNIKKLKSV